MPSHTTDFERYFNEMQIPRFVVEMPERDVFHIKHANALALKFFNQAPAHLLNRPIEQAMDQDNALHFQQSFEVAYSIKRSVTIQALPSVPGSVRVHGFYVSPILDAQGQVQYLDVIGQLEVTDQSVLAQERDDAVSLLTSIFEVSEVGVVVTDFNARIVRVNDSFIRTYGWGRDELINAHVTSLVTPDEREFAQSNHEKCINSGIRSSGEMKIIRKNGTIANALFTTATLELSQKRRFQVTTVMDITLRKQMEQSLRLAKDQADAANRAKSVFLANMSHELRTPLNAIIGFSEMMMKETFGPLGNPKYSEYMGDVHASAYHLLEIINEVLDMSKIEAGRIELDESEINLAHQIDSVLRMLSSKAFGNDVKLKSSVSEDLPHIMGDQRLVRQIFINLVTNAVKFSRAGTEVKIDAAMLEDGRIQITIADQGEGIPKDKIKQAMEPFGQVSDRAENATHQGTGLGLPLAKAMVELHEGDLDLDSDIGKGTTVFISFPAYRVLEKPPTRQLAESDTSLASEP